MESAVNDRDRWITGIIHRCTTPGIARRSAQRVKVPRFPGLFDDELHDIATAFDSLDVSFARAAANLVWPHFWPHFDDFWQDRLVDKAVLQRPELHIRCGGQGRDRTADLPLFRRTLIPTELSGRKALSASPCWRP